jgi:hypothetical protein
VPCDFQKFQVIDLIKDCSEVTPGQICSSSKVTVEREIKDMLKDTFGKWDNGYYFSITSKGGGCNMQLPLLPDPYCNVDSPGQVISENISTKTNGGVKVLLKVCR